MISVVVCTYNRSELLSKCLRSLVQQSLNKDLYEVIVADNNSTDDTQKILQEFILKEPNFRSCHEDRKGANHARNAGCRIARGEYIAFIDDDAVAYPDWLSNILEFIERHPEVVVFGGPYDAYSLVHKPTWFPPEYGMLSLGNEERPIKIGAEWVTGTNLIVRKNAFFRVGGFHEKLGSVEKGIFYFGEEIRLLIDFSEHGHTIYYVPTVRVKHLIRTDKMNLKYLLVSGYRMGRNHCLTLNVKRSLLSHLVSLADAGLKALFKILACNKVPIKRKLYYAFYPLFYQTGSIVEYFYLRLHIRNINV